MSQPPPILSSARQLLLCVSATWDAVDGRVACFARDAAGEAWAPVSDPFPVSLGRAGLAWAAAQRPEDADGVPVKREGDGRSPAGIFPVTGLFGYAPPGDAPAHGVGLPYRQATADLKCIDDPASRHYNRLVDQRRVGRVDWTSAEDMRRDDGRYEFGAVVGCNCDPVVAGAGSCIFLHVWSGDGVPTAGCTAMARADMMRVFGWLAGARSPVLVQLPEAAFAHVRDPWGLPDCVDRSVA